MKSKPKICRVVPAGLVHRFEDILLNKKPLDLIEEIRYNSRINKEKEINYD